MLSTPLHKRKMKINNCRELWAAWMGERSWAEEETEEKSIALLEKWVFRGTKCGCIFGINENGVYVGGYAEGSDAELPIYTLVYPFTLEEWTEALDHADAEGIEEWDRANDQDLARVVDEETIETNEDYDIGGEG
jgi:hypothetical protein